MLLNTILKQYSQAYSPYHIAHLTIRTTALNFGIDFAAS